MSTDIRGREAQHHRHRHHHHHHHQEEGGGAGLSQGVGLSSASGVNSCFSDTVFLTLPLTAVEAAISNIITLWFVCTLTTMKQQLVI